MGLWHPVVAENGAVINFPVDLVIFEGWCVASQAMTDAELQDPVNALEASADTDGRWRTYVNDKLGTEYVPLFAAQPFFMVAG